MNTTCNCHKTPRGIFQVFVSGISLISCVAIIILFGSSPLSSQNEAIISSSGWGKHTYLNQTQKLHKFKTEFSQDPMTLGLFQKFNRPRKAQVILNSASTGLALGTIGLAISTADESALGAVIVLLFGGAASGLLLGIGNLSTGPRKAKAKRELIKHINLGNVTADYSSPIKAFRYPTPIGYQEMYDTYSLNGMTGEFYLLESEIVQDNYSRAEFENFLIFRKRQQRALLFSYILGGAVAASEIANIAGIVDEDTAAGNGHRVLTRYLPLTAALGSAIFSLTFAKRKNASKDQLIRYINGEPLSSHEQTSYYDLNARLSGEGISLVLRF